MMVPKWQDRASTTYLCIFTYTLKAASPRSVTLLRKRLWHRYFPFNFTISKNTFPYKTSLVAASENLLTLRSCRLQMFFKLGYVKDFTEFTGKHLCQSPFFKEHLR